jgi:hypothetical protein
MLPALPVLPVLPGRVVREREQRRRGGIGGGIIRKGERGRRGLVEKGVVMVGHRRRIELRDRIAKSMEGMGLDEDDGGEVGRRVAKKEECEGELQPRKGIDAGNADTRR